MDISFDAIKREEPGPGRPSHIISIPGDFLQELILPSEVAGYPLLDLCAGLTLCNFEPDDVRSGLTQMRRTLGESGHLLVCIDIVKDEGTLLDAYKNGANAAFVLNVLARLNRECNADFDLAKFRYDPMWEENVGRMKMSVVSEVVQSARIQDEEFNFAKNEEVGIIYSYKYTINEFLQLAEDGTGWKRAHIWQDCKHRCALFLLKAEAEQMVCGRRDIGFGDIEASS